MTRKTAAMELMEDMKPQQWFHLVDHVYAKWPKIIVPFLKCPKEELDEQYITSEVLGKKRNIKKDKIIPGRRRKEIKPKPADVVSVDNVLNKNCEPKEDRKTLTVELKNDIASGGDKTCTSEPVKSSTNEQRTPNLNILKGRRSIIQTRAQKRQIMGETKPAHKPSSHCRNCAACGAGDKVPLKKTKK